MARWFGPKKQGNISGVYSWQGWVAAGLFLVLMFGSLFVDVSAYGLPGWSRSVFRYGLLIVFLLIIGLTYRSDPE